MDPANLTQQTSVAESNYTIQKNDLLALEVFTNQGEKIIDPNRESFKDGNGPNTGESPVHYVVDITGMMAGGVLAAIPPVVLALVFQRYIVRGLTAGAVKG